MGLTAAHTSKAWCEELFAFHLWRQAEIVKLLRELDAQFVSQQLSGSFGSLYIIMKHLVWAEKVWLGRVDNDAVANMRELDFPGLLEEWKATSAKWVSEVQQQAPEAFDQQVVYYTTKGVEHSNTLTEIVIHLLDHATYHIGQMMNAVRSFGIEPVSTNYIHYLRQKA